MRILVGPSDEETAQVYSNIPQEQMRAYIARLLDEDELTTFKFLVENKVLDVNIKDDSGWTPLMLAILHCNYNKVRTIIECGADVNTKDLFQQYSPLHIACHEGRLAVIKLLIKHGADVNVKDRAWDSLFKHISARHQAQIALYLADSGCKRRFFIPPHIYIKRLYLRITGWYKFNDWEDDK